MTSSGDRKLSVQESIKAIRDAIHANWLERTLRVIRYAAIVGAVFGFIASVIEIYDFLRTPDQQKAIDAARLKLYELLYDQGGPATLIATGRDLFTGSFDRAIKSLEKQGREGQTALRDFTSSGKTGEAEQILLALAEKSAAIGKEAESIETAAKSAAETAQAARRTANRQTSDYYSQAAALVLLNDMNRAEVYLTKAAALDTDNLPLLLSLRHLFQLRTAFSDPSYLDKLEQISRLIVENADRQKNDGALIIGLGDLAEIATQRKQPDQAQPYLDRAMLIAKASDQFGIQARVSLTAMRIHKANDELEKAAGLLRSGLAAFNALPPAEQNANRPILVETLLWSALLKEKQADLPAAIELQGQLYGEYIKDANAWGAATAAQKLADLYRKHGADDLAAEYFKRSLSHFDALKTISSMDAKVRATNYLGLGLIELQKGERTEGCAHLTTFLSAVAKTEGAQDLNRHVDDQIKTVTTLLNSSICQ